MNETDEGRIREQLESRYGRVKWTLGWRPRIYLAWRRVLHALGFHHVVRTYYWDESLGRLIDEGMFCRVCGSRG